MRDSMLSPRSKRMWRAWDRSHMEPRFRTQCLCLHIILTWSKWLGLDRAWVDPPRWWTVAGTPTEVSASWTTTALSMLRWIWKSREAILRANQVTTCRILVGMGLPVMKETVKGPWHPTMDWLRCVSTKATTVTSIWASWRSRALSWMWEVSTQMRVMSSSQHCD